MDYCSSCRRHLNGALVCPGCGAYAPDIDPAAAGGSVGPASGATPVGAVTAAESAIPAAWHENGDPGEVPPAPQGRAARRRQRARWKKNQRRAVVATAVALVAGGLTLSAVDRQSGDRAQAATAPQDPGANAVAEAEDGAAQDVRPPGPVRTDAHRSPSTPPARTPAPGLPHRQPAAESQRATPPPARQEAAAAPRATVTSAPPRQSTAPAARQTAPDRTTDTADTAGTTDTTDTQASTPAPAGDTSPTGGTSGTEPSRADTSPTQVCLLVLCLG
ncbi:hypothetical protein GCM10010377_46640 [Streptomyces viridiviolaceus]|uniref:Uncharacterized protein n=1 Tax=Streptomyces viridiviolaceus TaxID=68282 RepID=A0ABW2E1E6_9ACTN|nr:hypothetical protein [Streptomyces viridiviolaceus]GHB50233.1 hypothetical protein GCM10010377_46640 [Streptomyces viridiviolaceus]